MARSYVEMTGLVFRRYITAWHTLDNVKFNQAKRMYLSILPKYVHNDGTTQPLPFRYAAKHAYVIIPLLR